MKNIIYRTVKKTNRIKEKKNQEQHKKNQQHFHETNYSTEKKNIN
jgi:hypothetical protein